MIVWINGTHGVGKTSVAKEIKNIIGETAMIIEPDLYFEVFCKEKFLEVGGGCFPQNNKAFINDLREIIEIEENENNILIIPMTIATDESRMGLIDYFKEKTIVKHFILKADEKILKQRIDNDYNRDKKLALSCMKSNIEYFEKMFFEEVVICTNELKIKEVANEIINLIK